MKICVIHPPSHNNILVNDSEDKEFPNRLMPKDKFCLTVKEASSYFEIGEKKIRELDKAHPDDGLFSHHGVKVLVLREPFENFLMQTSEI